MEVRRDEATLIQQVGFLSRQGPASHRESSLAWWEATSITKRRQSDRQATTEVKRTQTRAGKGIRPGGFYAGLGGQGGDLSAGQTE